MRSERVAMDKPDRPMMTLPIDSNDVDAFFSFPEWALRKAIYYTMKQKIMRYGRISACIFLVIEIVSIKYHAYYSRIRLYSYIQ